MQCSQSISYKTRAQFTSLHLGIQLCFKRGHCGKSQKNISSTTHLLIFPECHRKLYISQQVLYLTIYGSEWLV